MLLQRQLLSAIFTLKCFWGISMNQRKVSSKFTEQKKKRFKDGEGVHPTPMLCKGTVKPRKGESSGFLLLQVRSFTWYKCFLSLQLFSKSFQKLIPQPVKICNTFSLLTEIDWCKNFIVQIEGIVFSSE